MPRKRKRGASGKGAINDGEMGEGKGGDLKSSWIRLTMSKLMTSNTFATQSFDEILASQTPATPPQTYEHSGVLCPFSAHDICLVLLLGAVNHASARVRAEEKLLSEVQVLQFREELHAKPDNM